MYEGEFEKDKKHGNKKHGGEPRGCKDESKRQQARGKRQADSHRSWGCAASTLTGPPWCAFHEHAEAPIKGQMMPPSLSTTVATSRSLSTLPSPAPPPDAVLASNADGVTLYALCADANTPPDSGMLRKLLKHGSARGAHRGAHLDPDAYKDARTGFGALQAASRNGHAEAVRILLAHGADVNARKNLVSAAAASRRPFLHTPARPHARTRARAHTNMRASIRTHAYKPTKRATHQQTIHQHISQPTH